jgi:hypothetical protein
LRELFRRAGDEIGETEGGFFSRTSSYTITSFIFYTGVTVEEKQMSELTPFFSSSPIFHGGQFQIFGDLLLFLAEVVEFDLLSLGRVFFIYFNESNVQRDQSGTMI